jgi:hypothetical protein
MQLCHLYYTKEITHTFFDFKLFRYIAVTKK